MLITFIRKYLLAVVSSKNMSFYNDEYNNKYIKEIKFV